MTDDLVTDIQGEDLVAPVGDVVDNDEAQKPVFNKVQMQDVVNREKQKAYERGRKEALMQLQQEQGMGQQQVAPEQVQQQAPSSLGGMQQVSQDDIKRLIQEAAPQAIQEHVYELQTKAMVNDFVQKMQAAEQRHPGLEQKLEDLEYETAAPIIQMANGLDNTGDIMAELLNNPQKMGNMILLAQMQPKLAVRQMQELSNSIKQNQEAMAQAQSAKDPLSQIKTSGNAGMDNGSMSVKDFQKMFRA